MRDRHAPAGPASRTGPTGPTATQPPTLTAKPPPIAPGAHIVVRDAVWRVQQVDLTSSGRHAWRVEGVSAIVRGQRAVFLEELDPEIRVLDPAETQLVLDPSAEHAAGIQLIDAMLRELPPEGATISVGDRAALDLLDFQLDPARQALGQLRHRILIADAVGLGKTLEAGILLSELARRGRARRILVVTTRAMLTQFQKELWTRFTIPLVRLDSEGIQRLRGRIPTNQNPFHVHDRAIISVDTLKQPSFQHLVERAQWDVIVIDEAHNVAERGDRSTLRARLANLLASRSDALILLSATPHDGRARSFASLMNMLDPTAIADPDHYGPEDIQGLFVRRFKRQVQDQVSKHFPDRVIHEARFRLSPDEDAAFVALRRLSLRSRRSRQWGRSGTSMLLRTVLEKTLLSSPRACLATLEAAIERRDTTDPDVASDVAALAGISEKVRAIPATAWTRYAALLTLLGGGSGAPAWKPRPADRLVIFTESRQTLEALAERLPADLGLPADAVAVLHGGLGDMEQQRIVEAFGKRQSRVRLLLTTDVASEGLNLHYQCHRLVHFDVPWSLMTFQQRNGRVDRYGQEQEPHLAYLVAESADDQVQADLRILEVLIEKDRKAGENIDDPSMLGGADAASQEETTARAMEQQASAADFEALLGNANPFETLLAAAAPPRPKAAPLAPPHTLFPTDFDAIDAAIRLAKTDDPTAPMVAKVEPLTRTIDLVPPPDLERRLRRLPGEAQPTSGRLVLTDDVALLQGALREALAAEENPWPQVHYLWPLHPVLDWAAERARRRFARHTAPVLHVRALPAGESVLLVSGMVPNRRAQPVVHRWYGAVFRGTTFDRVEDLATVLGRTRLRGARLVNPGPSAFDLPRLQTLVPEAIERVRERCRRDRDEVDETLQRRLDEQIARLAELERRHRSVQLALPVVGGRPTDVELRIRRLFDSFVGWATDSLTTEPTPFLQLVAVLQGNVLGGAAP